jgi:hypothetical protein
MRAFLWKIGSLFRHRNPCSWCLAERGEQPRACDSHGICAKHAAEMRAAIEGMGV